MVVIIDIKRLCEICVGTGNATKVASSSGVWIREVTFINGYIAVQILRTSYSSGGFDVRVFNSSTLNRLMTKR
jgi:hypothetical protein